MARKPKYLPQYTDDELRVLIFNIWRAVTDRSILVDQAEYLLLQEEYAMRTLNRRTIPLN